MQYRVCPRCGDHLDHGERCGCQDKKEGPPRRSGNGPQIQEPTTSLSASLPGVKPKAAVRRGVTPDAE